MPLKSQKYLHKSSKNDAKIWFKQVFWEFWKSSPKISQIFELPKQNIDSQMVLKVARMAANCQSWQHC